MTIYYFQTKEPFYAVTIVAKNRMEARTLLNNHCHSTGRDDLYRKFELKVTDKAIGRVIYSDIDE